MFFGKFCQPFWGSFSEQPAETPGYLELRREDRPRHFREEDQGDSTSARAGIGGPGGSPKGVFRYFFAQFQ